MAKNRTSGVTSGSERNGLMREIRDIAASSTDAMDLWTNLDEEQQRAVTDLLREEGGFSMDSLRNLFDRLDGGTNVDEWKPPQGSVKDLPTDITVPKDVGVKKITMETADLLHGEGWMANANDAGVIEMRQGLSPQHAMEVLAHEFGHQLSNWNPALGTEILSNPENIFGRFNRKNGHFESRYSYSPEEAFAESFSMYMHHRDYVKRNDPKLYDYYSELLRKNPAIRTELSKVYKAYGV